MLTVISPAKTLDFDTPSIAPTSSEPVLLDHSEQLVNIMSSKSPHDLQNMMGISDKLAELNVERFHQWHRPFTAKNAKAAALAFKGDVYVGMDAESFSNSDFDFAQNHLRILSGLYGVLRPLDLIQPYRLEMGVKVDNPNGNTLYKFWGDTITETLNTQLEESGSPILLNLASNEYFKSIKKKSLNAQIVTPAFKDWKNDQYKMISFFAKKARGLMAAWVIKNQVNDAEQLLDFSGEGYSYNAELSDEDAPVFTRQQI